MQLSFFLHILKQPRDAKRSFRGNAEMSASIEEPSAVVMELRFLTMKESGVASRHYVAEEENGMRLGNIGEVKKKKAKMG